MTSLCHTLAARPLCAAPSPSLRPRRLPVVLASATPPAGGGGAGAGSNNFSTRLEHMDTLLLHKHHDLDLAENELCSHCSRLSPEDETEKCWQAYSFLEQKRERAKQGCERGDLKDCEELDRLNDITHQLLATGSMDDLVATFSTLARVEELRSARAAQQAQQAASPPAQQQPAGQPDKVHELFVRMDSNGDGRLSVAEFRQGMDFLGEHLDGSTVALVCDAMDVHGFLSEQQFRDIVEAEALVSRSQVMEMYRHRKHDSPAWWGSRPSVKGSMLS